MRASRSLAVIVTGSGVAYPARVESADEPVGPTRLFENGPYLHVALSDDLRPIVPLNATVFVREWEHALDPVELLRAAARKFLSEQAWLVEDCFVVPSWITLHKLQDARTDEDVIHAFRSADADVRWGEDDAEGMSVGDFVIEGAGSEFFLTSFAQPILMGLAVAATLEAVIGKAGSWLRQRWDADEAARRERRPYVRNGLDARGAARYARDHVPDYPPEQ